MVCLEFFSYISHLEQTIIVFFVMILLINLLEFIWIKLILGFLINITSCARPCSCFMGTSFVLRWTFRSWIISIFQTLLYYFCVPMLQFLLFLAFSFPPETQTMLINRSENVMLVLFSPRKIKPYLCKLSSFQCSASYFLMMVSVSHQFLINDGDKMTTSYRRTYRYQKKNEESCASGFLRT